MWRLEEPVYLYGLLLLPLLALLFAHNLMWQRKKRAEFGDPALVKKLAPERSSFKAGLKFVVILLALGSILLALVNPKAGLRTDTMKREGIDIVFAVDVSKSMLAEDVAPNRLEKSKQIVSQIISGLGTDRVGIVGYAGSAYPVLPITADFTMAKMSLQGMNTNLVSSQGTAIAEAIQLANSFFDNPKSGKLLVLLSDGEDHGGGISEFTSEAQKKGIRIVTIGLGTEDGAPIPVKRDGVTEGLKRDNNGKVVVTKLDPVQLKAIAEKTKGEYIYGAHTKEVAAQVQRIIENIEKTEFEVRQVAGFDAQYQWFAGIAFALLFLDIFLLEKRTAWISKLNLFNEKEQ